MSRLHVTLAPISGALALVLAAAGLIAETTHGGSVSMTASVVLGALGGGLALWQHRRLGALVTADALLAGAVLVSLFAFGTIFVFPLVPMLVATAATPATVPQAKHGTPSAFAPAFAAGLASQSGSVVRRAGAAVARRLVRAPMDQPEPVRRSA
jgi:hypothetical protein